jgi:hypothetical protein
VKRFTFWLLLVLDRLSLWIENMANSYYTPSGQPISSALGRAVNIRSEFASVSTGFDAVEAAMALKAPLASPTFTGTVAGITKSMVGLGNVDNTADTAKPVSTAQQTALNLKANLAGATFTADLVINGLTVGAGSGLSANTTFGVSALSAGGSAQNRTAIGAFALTASTGNNNTAVGAYAAAAFVSGANNTAIGQSALDAATSGTNNTAVGNGALSGSTGSTEATAIGASAGAGATGIRGTYLGASAGNTTTTGTNNTIIGFNAQGASAGASDAVTLGNSSITTLRCQVTSITALSDERDKTAISDLSFGLDFLASLRPVAFTWNARDGSKVGIRSSGFIAQELKAAQDQAGAAETLRLVYEENPDKLEASYGHLIPVMVKAIQELRAEVDSLRSQLIG